MSGYLHKQLPPFSTLLAGSQPRDEYSFHSDHLQIWYNNTEKTWQDPAPHYHTASDEIYIVLKGELLIATGDETLRLKPGEYACFQAGTIHNITEVRPPVECFIIRAPSRDDKIYLEE